MVDAHSTTVEPFVRPTARLNNWTPHVQPHGPGTKFNRPSVHPKLPVRHATTLLHYPKRPLSTLQPVRFPQRSRSMDSLNPIHLTNPEVLDFVQKRQLVSDQIRANRISMDENTLRSRGLYRLVPDKPSNGLNEETAVKESENENVVKPAAVDRTSFGYRAPLTEWMRTEREGLCVFYSSLTTEVLSAPLPVQLYVRQVDGARLDADLLHSDQSQQWQPIGHGHLVIIAHYEHRRFCEVTRISVQLCQPRLFSPIWSARLAFPLCKYKSNQHRQRERSGPGKTEPHADTVPCLASLLYNKASDSAHVHRAFVYQTKSRDLSNRAKSPKRYDSKRSAPADHMIHLVSQWKFECPDGNPISASQLAELDVFFNDVQKLIGRALVSHVLNSNCFSSRWG
ncbi:unnamed protein product [Echinostoma caproni]|uniref:CACTA en-spm transposon protein n=1 Tax=Echinostoma caproni TaxID=27848 RepID=A0A183AKI9_9TREM|nr:unnamed protein product [Echinostoma caproni]